MIKKIRKIVTECANIHLKYFKSDKLDIEFKLDEDDPVTRADKEAELFLRKELWKLLPDSQFLWEEWKNVIEDYSWYVWIVDPLDGTKNYSKWIEKYSIIIWLCLDWVPEIWILYFPTTWECFSAQRWKWARYQNPNNEASQIIIDQKLSEIDFPPESASKVSAAMWERFEVNPDQNLFKNKITQKEFQTSKSNQCVSRSCWLILKGEQSWFFRVHDRLSKRDTCWLQVILEEAWWNICDLEWNNLDYTVKESNRLNWVLAWTIYMTSYLVEQLHR